MTSLKTQTVAALLACLGVAGCVSPGEIDVNLLTRYQESVLARSPQRRAGEDGLELLTAIPDPTISLQVEVDPQTGTRVIRLSLEAAVQLALMNSTDISIVAYEPAIAREDMVQAAAVFDYIVFASSAYTRTDRNAPSVLASSKTKTIPATAGVRNTNILGGVTEARWDFVRTSDNSPFTTPDPRYESIFGVFYTQPLLRFAGPDFNLATLHLAQLGEEVAYARFRQEVENIITQVQTLYWTLVQVREDVEIQKDLLTKTLETLERIKKRAGIDATQVVIKQTEAAVATRRAALIVARKLIYDVQDQLARLLADDRFMLANAYVILPSVAPPKTEVAIDTASQLINALRYNPALEQARLAIASAEINVRVARNETLPVLDLTASTGTQGLHRHGEKAIDEMLGGKFHDYSLGFTFEYPLGNRQAEAALRQRKLEKFKSIAELQNIADLIAVSVKEAIRQILTSFEEMEVQEVAVMASQMQLDALNVLEKNTERLTPEFLQVKLQAQAQLALAKRGRIRARVGYNNALAELTQVTGTTLRSYGIKLRMKYAIAPRPPVTTLPSQPSVIP